MDGGVRTKVTELGAGKLPILREIENHRKIWRELFWNMAEGDVTRYNEIKRLNVFEFWKYFDFWRERMSKRIEANRKNNR